MVSHIKTLHISFRERFLEPLWENQTDGPPSWEELWVAVSKLHNLREIKLWLDGDSDNTRFYIVRYRNILQCVNDSTAKKLVVSLPCSKEDLRWWSPDGDCTLQGVMTKPLFRIQARGWPRYHEYRSGHVHYESIPFRVRGSGSKAERVMFDSL
jgi:hypothetical protein